MSISDNSYAIFLRLLGYKLKEQVKLAYAAADRLLERELPHFYE